MEQLHIFFVTDLFGLTEVLSTAFSCTAHWLGFDLFEPCFVSDTSFSFFDKDGLLFLSSFGRLAEGSTNVDFLFWAAISVKNQATQLLDALSNIITFHFYIFTFPFIARSCCDQKANHQSSIKPNYTYFTYRFLQKAIDV